MEIPPRRRIGTLSEKSYHASIKKFYSQPGDQTEVTVGSYVVDILRDDLIIEVQTQNFYALRSKMSALLDQYRILIVYPIPMNKWILYQNADEECIRKRKSPKNGKIYDLFRELVYIPQFLNHPHLQIEVVFTHLLEIRRNDGKGSWRRSRWSIIDQELLAIEKNIHFHSLNQIVSLIPGDLKEPFSNREIAHELKCPESIARKITYTLSRANALTKVGKAGKRNLFQRALQDFPPTTSFTDTSTNNPFS